MPANLQNLCREAFLNNSYDYDSMDKELLKAWNNSYSYLYTMQKAYVEYEELFYYSNDDTARNSKLIGNMYLDKWNYACFDVDYDMIHVYSREEYRLSKFYNNPYTIDDIRNNPTIFLKMPIILIDDKVIWDYSIFTRKDKTTIALPFRRNFVISLERDPETGELVYIDHKIQIMIVDNRFYERVRLNKNTINFSAITKTISIPKSVFTSKLPISSGIYMASLHIPSIHGGGYELGTNLIPLTDEGDYFTAELTDDLNVLLHNTGQSFYLSMVHVCRLNKHEFYFGGNINTVDENNEGTLMVLQEEEMIPYKMPIPVEDFVIFRKQPDEEGYILVKNTEILELHYPNIYILKDEERQPGSKYKIYYFYYNNYDLKYTVLFDFYFRFLVNTFSHVGSLEAILDGIYKDTIDYSIYTEDQIESFKEVFEKIITYEYYNHQYGEMDFLYRYTKIPGNEDKEPIEYKDEILKSWIRVEPHVLKDYVREQKKLGESYHLFTNTLDLSERYRVDTSVEFGEPAYTFEEPMYVFGMENSNDYPLLLECRVFVDGLFVNELVQLRKLYMDYLYIPARMVTDDSYIEIEVFPSYTFKEDMTFTSLNDEKELTLITPKEAIWPTLKDAYFLSVDDDPQTRYDAQFFDFNIHYYDRYDDIGEIFAHSDDPEKPVKFTRLVPHTFKVKPNDDVVLNKPLRLCFTKNSLRYRLRIDTPCYPMIAFTETEWNWNFNTDYLRIYRNGRLIPRCKYQFTSTFARPLLLIFEYFEAGEIISIDISPYRYTEIYYQEEVTPEADGDVVVDLSDILTKPFDIRYYDVYMNGRKLSINNVFNVSPYQISLVNLKSFYNLEIYERERDWEYFGLNYKEKIYYYTIDDLFNENFITEEDRDKLIEGLIEEQKDPRLNIYPNTNDEEKQDHSDIRKFAQFYLFYHFELIPNTYENPDRLQENQEIMTDVFYYIDQAYSRTPYMEAATYKEMMRRRNYPRAILLDPDVTIGDGNPNNLYYVFPVGHLEDELPEEYREQTVVINNDPNINT